MRTEIAENKPENDIILQNADIPAEKNAECRYRPAVPVPDETPSSYWDSLDTRIFTENSGCIDYLSPVDTRLKYMPEIRKLNIIRDLRGTRFEDEKDPFSVIRILLVEFIKWTEMLKGRLPVPDYDIADDRLDNEKETEFYHIVQKWLYAALMKDSEKFGGISGRDRCDEARVRNVSWSLAVVFCAYYHHAFDMD